MMNSKGETIYTNAEIAYELGLNPTTINAVGKKLFGSSRVAHWTLNDVKLICEYIKSISVEEDAKRLAALHSVVEETMRGTSKMSDEETRKRVNNDVYKV